MNKNLKKLKEDPITLSYIAGFIDGDGSIYGQIIKDNTRKWKFRIIVKLAFYQKTKRNWYLLWLQKIFGKIGYFRVRKTENAMSDYTIAGKKEVLEILKMVYPYLKLKKNTCKIAIEVLESIESIEKEEEFIEVCKKLDKLAESTDSKKRKIDKEYVKNSLNLLKTPVETS